MNASSNTYTNSLIILSDKTSNKHVTKNSLAIKGGVGVEKDLYVKGDIHLDGNIYPNITAGSVEQHSFELSQNEEYKISNSEQNNFENNPSKMLDVFYVDVILNENIALNMNYHDPMNFSSSPDRFNDNSTLLNFYNNDKPETSANVWYGLQVTNGVEDVTHIGFVNTNTSELFFAKSFSFESSMNGDTWTTHLTKNNEIYVNEPVIYELPEKIKSKYFRFKCLVGNDSKYWILTELMLYNNVETIYQKAINGIDYATYIKTNNDIVFKSMRERRTKFIVNII